MGTAGSRRSEYAGDPEAGDREAGGGHCREPLLGGELDFAVERIGPRHGFFVEHGTCRLRAVNRAGRQEHAAFRACPPRGFEQCDAGVEIEPPEAVGRIALAAAIAARNMIEGGVDEMGYAGEHRGFRPAGIERHRQEWHRTGERVRVRRRPTGDSHVEAGLREMLDDEAPNEARAAGDEHAHGAGFRMDAMSGASPR